MASPFPISNIPLVLFPLKLETRFVDNELWIRAFPDVAFLQSHDPRLSEEEREDAGRFKALEQQGNHPDDDEAERKIDVWSELVSKYGVYRAAWIVQISPRRVGTLR